MGPEYWLTFSYPRLMDHIRVRGENLRAREDEKEVGKMLFSKHDMTDVLVKYVEKLIE